MSKAIWKFPVEVTDEFTVLMPEASEVLSVAMQGDGPQMWALVDLTTPMKNRTFLVVGTGNPVPENAGRFIGTWQCGPFVWHLFEAARGADGRARQMLAEAAKGHAESWRQPPGFQP